MRVVAFSDSHLHSPALQRICRVQQQADLFVHLGDGQGDVAWLQDEIPGLPLVWVRGNCDFSQDGDIEKLLELEGVRLLAVHGHTLSVKYGYDALLRRAAELKAKVALFGHTHNPYCEYTDDVWLVNPGSVVYRTRLRFATVDITPAGISCNLCAIAR